MFYSGQYWGDFCIRLVVSHHFDAVCKSFQCLCQIGWCTHLFSTNVLYERSQFSTCEHKGLLRMSVIEWSLQWPWRKVLNLSLRSMQGPCQVILITFCPSHLDTCVKIRYSNQTQFQLQCWELPMYGGFPLELTLSSDANSRSCKGGVSNHNIHYWFIKDMLILHVLRYYERLIDKPCAIY